MCKSLFFYKLNDFIVKNFNFYLYIHILYTFFFSPSANAFVSIPSQLMSLSFKAEKGIFFFPSFSPAVVKILSE